MGIRLDGKVAVITGATGGWGGGAAVALARRGAAVVLNARTQSKLDAFADRLTGEGLRAVGVAQDIRTLAGAEALVERAVDELGRVDILMNAVGVTNADGDASTHASILDTTEEAWRYTIDAELTAAFNCTKAAATQMVAQGEGGAIVSVVGTIIGSAGRAPHAAAKGGLLNGIWSWSDELREHGITVNGVRGYVRSMLTDPSFDIEQETFVSERTTPELPTQPIEAGELIAWLASAEDASVTGQYIGIDGPRVTIWEPSLPQITVFREPQWSAEQLASSVGPIIGRRPPRPTMTEVVKDLFSARDTARTSRA
jgi:NAD(P)-dependent dehydrogenase (short-subunit alcohol dehydrogenase family)